MSEDEELAAEDQQKPTSHDEAFKKLLQTFFREFVELFFPELGRELDYSHTRFLMQELLVDVVGQESRELDLLLEVRYITRDAYILILVLSAGGRRRTNDFASTIGRIP
jgi:hypothetical protein